MFVVLNLTKYTIKGNKEIKAKKNIKKTSGSGKKIEAQVKKNGFLIKKKERVDYASLY